MSANEIAFDLPIWSAVVWHTQTGATNPWTRAFNIAETGDPEENERMAIRKVKELFEGDGLLVITIYAIQVAPLIKIEGGEEIA